MCALAGLGCLGTEAEVRDQVDRLADCRGSATDAEVSEAILITEEYALGLAADLEISWFVVIFTVDFTVLWAQTLVGAPLGAPPDWSYADGVYHYGGPTAAIELRLYDPDGAQVIENVFDLDSYLVNAQITHDDQADTTTIGFDAPGPLVERLGLGPTPANPLVLDAAGREQLLDALGAMSVEPDYIAFAITRSTTLDYHARGERQTIAALASEGVDLRLELVAINASREATGQTLTTDELVITSRVEGSRGHTTFEVTGGLFDYVGRVDFDVALAPERQLDCP